MSNPLCLLADVYRLILLIRVVLSFVILFRPGWVPSGPVRGLADMVYALTDPPVNLLRRYIPPLSSSGFALDLAFLTWFLIVIFLIRPALCAI